jgi:hypothetical protein
MAAFTELFIDQGTTFNSTIYLSDDVTNADVNVAGYSISSQMRRSYYSANATADLTCVITNAATGEITLSLTDGETANIKSGRYLFDVVLTSDVGNVSRILEGIITVNPRVTQ